MLVNPDTIAAVATDPCKDRCVLVGQTFGILNGTGVRLTGCYHNLLRRWADS